VSAPHVLDITVSGDPASCVDAGTTVWRVAGTVDGATGQLNVQRSHSESLWFGSAADAFRGRVATLTDDLATLASRLERAGRALDTFGTELSAVKTAMAAAVNVACAGGLAVTAGSILGPTETSPTAATIPTSAAADQAATWNTVMAMVGQARQRESAAHTELDAQLQLVSGDGWIATVLQKLGFLPSGGDAPGTTLWALGLTGTGMGVGTDWMIKGRYGKFQPRIGGKFVSASGLNAWDRFKASFDDSSWHAGPNQASVRGKWIVAGRWATRGGVAVSFATAGWGEWQADSSNPSLDTGNRVARAATVGAATAAGAWAGAEVGAELGAALGTAIAPGLGTVVGGAVGGIVGGFAGSEVGGAIGDWAKGTAGTVVDGIGHGASDLLQAVEFWN
jgi:uncharacterized protein YukE